MLRKKPPGRLLSTTAHKVEREHRVISALYGYNQTLLKQQGGGGGDGDGGADRRTVPVPRPYVLCEDASVLGTPFYVMEFLDGRIIEDPYMASPAFTPAERNALWRAAVETLARLHAVDLRAAGLDTFGGGGGGKKASGSGGGKDKDKGNGSGNGNGGFYARQVHTWRRICEAQARATDADTGEAVGDLPHFRELLGYFEGSFGGAGGEGVGAAAAAPRDRVALVHGDFKIDNLVFHRTEPRVIGILDWEMSTVGHPLSDLANLLHPFYGAGPGITAPTPSPSPATPSTSTEDPRTQTPGLPDPATAVSWYGAASGRAVAGPEMAWALAFSVFRLAAVCQGIAARVATRQASSAEARRYAAAMAPLADVAWDMVRRAQEARGPAGGSSGISSRSSGGEGAMEKRSKL